MALQGFASVGPSNRVAASRMRSVQRTIASSQVQRPRAAPAPAPYVHKRPETPPMTGLLDTTSYREQAAETAAASPAASSGGGGGGGGAPDSSGGGGQSPEEQKYEQEQAEYVQKLAAYNAQLAEQGPSTSLVPPTPPKNEGIFTRFFNWLFGKKSESKMSGDPVVNAVASLVQRARQGDQNAMGMIASVRKSAAQGNTRAQHAFRCLKKYIEQNPVGKVGGEYYKIRTNRPFGEISGDPFPGMSYYSDTGDSGYMIGPAFGAEERGALRARTALANHAILTNDRISCYADKFNGEGEKELFAKGVKKFRHEKKIKKHAACLPSDKARALLMGSDIGHARNIQRVRLPHTMISDFSPIVGWELGE